MSELQLHQNTVFWNGFQVFLYGAILGFVDCTPMNTAHTAQYSLFTSAERVARAWLKNCITSLCAWKESVIWSAHVSPFVALTLARTTSTSSSSFTLPSTTTPEHVLQSGQNDLLQEHPVHHQPLHDLPVDKQRHQGPLWRENLQSGGSPRKTLSTVYEPKELATVPRISHKYCMLQAFPRWVAWRFSILFPSSTGFTVVKKTACLPLLRLVPPGINSFLIMEFNSFPFPTW